MIRYINCEDTKKDILNYRYCLKAIEHSLYYYCRICENNVEINKDLSEPNDSFNFNEYFGKDEHRNNPINTIEEFFSIFDYDNTGKLNENEIYNKLKNHKDTIGNDKDLKASWVWVRFLIVAIYVYDEIVKILEDKKISKIKKKSNERNYFIDLYKTRIKEYEMILRDFKNYIDNLDNINEEDDMKKFLKEKALVTLKNVFTPAYKDILFIEYRRPKENSDNDNGFDIFPCEFFN